MGKYVVIDIGSSSVRAAVISKDLHISAMEVCRRKMGEYFDPEAEWEIVRRLTGKVIDSSVDAVAVSALLGWIGVDQNGNAVTPGYSYMHRDTEGYSGAEGLLKDKEDRCFTICGRQPCAEWPVFQLLSFQRKQPQSYRRIWKLLSLKDYINYRFTGCFAMDHTTAAYTWLFDVGQKCWSREMTETFHVKQGMLPTLKQPAERIGFITEDLLTKWKLTERSIPVVVGSVDGSAAMLGAGAYKTGQTVNVMGTTGVLFTVEGNYRKDYDKGLVINPHVIPGKWLAGGPMGMFGGTVGWLMEMLKGDKESLDRLSQKAMNIPPGNDGVTVFPTLEGERAPFWNPGFHGTILGLRSVHKAEHLLRGIMEAESYTIRRILEKNQKAWEAGEKIRVIGGGAVNEVWLQIKADILGKPVARLKNKEATMYGSLFLCMLAMGHTVEQLPDIEEEIKILPDQKHQILYEKLYRTYLKQHDIINSLYQ